MSEEIKKEAQDVELNPEDMHKVSGGYTEYDPEVNSAIRGSKTSGLTPGADYSAYPKSFSWTVGANITF